MYRINNLYVYGHKVNIDFCFLIASNQKACMRTRKQRLLQLLRTRRGEQLQHLYSAVSPTRAPAVCLVFVASVTTEFPCGVV